jgi:hypothetical protein
LARSYGHRTDDGEGNLGCHDCTEHFTVRDRAPGRPEVVIAAGSGHLVPDGILRADAVMRGDDYLNLNRLRVVRALLTRQSAGWRPSAPGRAELAARHCLTPFWPAWRPQSRLPSRNLAVGHADPPSS